MGFENAMRVISKIISLNAPQNVEQMSLFNQNEPVHYHKNKWQF